MSEVEALHQAIYAAFLEIQRKNFIANDRLDLLNAEHVEAAIARFEQQVDDAVASSSVSPTAVEAFLRLKLQVRDQFTDMHEDAVSRGTE